MDPDLLDRIPGARELETWFGEWPSFHDAEILVLHLEREMNAAESWLRLDTSRRTNRVDENGYFVREKHAVVTFFLDDVFDLDLCGFSNQNVVSGLQVEAVVNDSPYVPRPRSGFRLSLIDCYGLSGRIDAARVRIEFAAGAPA